MTNRVTIKRNPTVADLVAVLSAMPQNKLFEIEIDTDLRADEGLRVRAVGDVVVVSYFPEDDVDGVTGRNA